MTNTKATKVSAAIVKAYEKAKDATLQALHAAHDVEQAGAAKASELRTVAINVLIDKGRAAGAESGTIKDDVAAIFEKAVEAEYLADKSAKLYLRGVAFALERGVMWNASLHGTEARVKALQEAGKSIPKDLQEAAAKLDAKTRDAKHGKPVVANVENTVKLLAKAYEMAVLIGKAGWAVHIKETIQAEKPEWTPPTADDVK